MYTVSESFGNIIVLEGNISHYSYFDDLYKTKFMSIFKYLQKKYGCTYLFYLLKNIKTKKTIMFTSSIEWQKMFIENKLMDHCPISQFGVKMVAKSTRADFISIWNQIPITTKEQANVCGVRSEFNIANGVSFTCQNSSFMEAISLAGEKKHYDFYKQILFDDINMLQHVAHEIEAIAKLKLVTTIKQEYNQKNHILIN